MRTFTGAGAAALFSGLLVAACGGHASTRGGDAGVVLPQECELFLASYETSLNALGPPRVARARAAQVRASLEARMSDPSSEARGRTESLCEEQEKTWKRKNDHHE